MSGDPAFVRRTVAGVTVELRAQPRARRTALDCAGGALKAQVTAPAEDGKANAAVIELLADTWRLPKSAFSVTRGASSRDKVISIAGEPALLAARIMDWARESAGRDG
ncbi:MAG TPA: DUF167 domain-containing protein [Reyranella sp.]|nr:DUF167 domain-containing protein [Reyranella sp.]